MSAEPRGVKTTRLLVVVLGLMATLGLLLTAGCNSAGKRKWLTFFFDGVPPEGAGTARPPAASFPPKAL